MRAQTENDIATVVLRATLLLVAFAVGRFFYRGYAERMRFRALERQGFVIGDHSLIWGHLHVLGKYTRAHPPDNSTNHLTQWIVKHWQVLIPDATECPNAIYLDLWPFSWPILFVIHPKLSAQFTQTKNLPKHQTERDFLRPLTNNKDMVSSDGEHWKRWRTVFNPGFSSRNITGLVPTIMDDMLTFVNVLDSVAEKDGQPGQVVQLEKLTTNLTFDIIGKATLGLNLNEQSGTDSPLKTAMTDMTKRIGTQFSIRRMIAVRNPWSRIHRSNRVMRDYLMPHIRRQLFSPSSNSDKGAMTIMDLAAVSIRKGGWDKKTLSQDGKFMDTVLENLKTFLFAGHDTTATTICWAFKLLGDNPDCLGRMRREHDECLGPDPAAAPERIVRAPHVINAMPYTLGCIKETLRLYTPAGTMRAGIPDFFLVDHVSGQRYPTDGFGLADGILGIHRRDDVWPRADEFLPERWLVKEGDPLFPMKDAWRPFEQGPRNCIGQELAMMELKLVLALVVRQFDIEQAWDQWDILRGHTGPGEMIDGERLYMIGDGTGHTKDSTPVLVRRRKVGTAA